MDPVSVISAGAAALQFAGLGATALFGTIKLIRNLRNVPERLRILFGDVEKAIHQIDSLQSALQNPTSRIVTQLENSQVVSLQALVDDAHSAITDVHRKLQRVSGPQDKSKRKRAWQAVISIELEKEIEKELERIRRINDELMRQLQLTGIEMQADLRLCVADMAKMAKSLRKEVERLRVGEHEAHEETRAVIRSVLREHQAATQSTLTELRNAIVTLATGETGALEPAQATVAVELSQQGTEQLARQICETLVTFPSALSQSCDNMVSVVSRAASPYLTAKFGLKTISCSCKPSRRHSSWKQGFVRLNYETQATHWPSCPFAKTTKRSSQYTISVKLLPLIEKTVAIVFRASFQGGGFSITPTLKVFATVRRAESPLFRLFDDFPSLCSRRCYHTDGRFRNLAESQFAIKDTVINDNGMLFCFDWDVEAVRIQLRVLAQRLVSLAVEGKATLTDKDETGRTLLHEVVQLIGYLGSKHTDVLTEIQCLLTLADRANLDLGASGSMRSGSRHELVVRTLCTPLVGRERNGTAQDVTVLFAFHYSSFADFTLYGYFEKFNLDYASSEVFDPGSEGSHGSHHASYMLDTWRLYKTYPDLLENQGPLESAICRRSLADLEILLKSGVDNAQWIGRCFGLLELSLDWIPGLHALLAAKIFNEPHALGLALLLGNLPAAKVLLSSLVNLFQYPVLEYAMAANDEAQTVVIDEITKRRMELRELARAWLTQKDQIVLGIDLNKLPDSNAAAVYHRLSSSGIDVPASLNPQNRSLWKINTFETIRIESPTQPTAFFEKLLASGFKDFDESHSPDCGRTPLMWYVQHLAHNPQDQKALAIALWLLNRGVCLKQEDMSPPSILFCAALLFDYDLRWDGQLRRGVSDFVRLSVSLGDPLLTDSCNCFCSEHGCLCTSVFLDCEKRPPGFIWHWSWNVTTRADLDRKLFAWFSSCDLSGSQRSIYINHAVRLEAFKRLGLVHTCCTTDHSCWNTDSELQVVDSELQDEHWELKEQLKLIMEAFGRFQTSFDGSELDLLNHWWAKLDAILPDLQPKSRCRWDHASSADSQDTGMSWAEQADLEAQTLFESGYDGLDFTEVINLHFREYLSSFA